MFRRPVPCGCARARARRRAARSSPRKLRSARASAVLDVGEQRRIGAQRRELLEQQRELALLAEHRRRKILDRAVAVDEPRRARFADARRCRDSRRPCRRPARGSRGSAPARRRTSRARRRHCGSPSRGDPSARRDRRARTARDPCRASRCRPSRRARLPRRARRRGERIVGFELDHRPHGHAHRGERFLQRMKLRPQRRLDAVAGLVAGPQVVAERLDDVIGRDADVRGAASRSSRSTVLSTPIDGAERLVLALAEAAQAVEVTEQLVGAVDEMDDHVDELAVHRALGATMVPHREQQHCEQPAHRATATPTTARWYGRRRRGWRRRGRRPVDDRQRQRLARRSWR